jgi:hypothetical protein
VQRSVGDLCTVDVAGAVAIADEVHGASIGRPLRAHLLSVRLVHQERTDHTGGDIQQAYAQGSEVQIVELTGEAVGRQRDGPSIG